MTAEPALESHENGSISPAEIVDPGGAVLRGGDEAVQLKAVAHSHDGLVVQPELLLHPAALQTMLHKRSKHQASAVGLSRRMMFTLTWDNTVLDKHT